MLPYSRNVPAAKVTKAAVLGLLLMVLERFKERAMLHHGVVYLAFQKVDTTVHICSQLMILTTLGVAHHGPINTLPGDLCGSNCSVETLALTGTNMLLFSIRINAEAMALSDGPVRSYGGIKKEGHEARTAGEQGVVKGDESLRAKGEGF